MLIPTDPPSGVNTGDPNEWVLSGRSIDSEEWGVKLIALTRVHRGPSLYFSKQTKSGQLIREPPHGQCREFISESVRKVDLTRVLRRTLGPPHNYLDYFSNSTNQES